MVKRVCRMCGNEMYGANAQDTWVCECGFLTGPRDNREANNDDISSDTEK